MFSRCRFALILLLPALTAPGAETLSYNSHIRPILANNCFACHGTDAAHRKGKLRLDEPESATADRDGVRALVPGNLAASELWQRIISPHDDEVMPPPESNKPPLSAEQRALLKRWIEEGGTYQKHWAFEAIARPTPPPAAGGAGAHPIDRFVGAKLAAQRLNLSPEAPRETLVRRLTLDLTGLPPSPDEVDAFLADQSPGAYERLVDRLLASPRYGEQFARGWLDAVRYADTHGLHLDNVRTIWPYRDWVVAAFNRNLPFDQFTIEQLAGDLLPNPRVDQLVATGYNRNILSTSEGGAIEAEAEMRNTGDRVDTTAAVWLGLTSTCASCHDHKFDPITTKDFYAFGAFFKGLADRCWDGNVRVSGPVAVIAKDPAMQRRVDEVYAIAPALEAALSARADVLVEGGLAPLKTGKQAVTYEVIWAEDSDLPTRAAFAGASNAGGQWQEGPEVPVKGGKRALRLAEKGEHVFPFTLGDVQLVVGTGVEAFVHVYLDPVNPPRAVSLELVSEAKTHRLVWGDAQAFGPEAAKTARFGGKLPKQGGYVRLEVTACESGVPEGKQYTGLRIAQSDGAAWWDRAGALITSASGSDDPLLSKDAWVRQMQSKARDNPLMPLRHDMNFLLGLSGTQQTAEEKQRVVRYHRDFIYAPYRAALEPEAHAARRVMAEQMHYEATLPVSPIVRELPEPRPAHIMVRGAYDKPGERVFPATPAFLPPLQPAGDKPTRLDLARWLVRPEHPLTARVTVNRFWAQLIGAGLVRTPNDFGAQGEPPTHPELLDWLAREFMTSGWDVKKLVRQIVTSRTYRQNATVSPALLELDPSNRWLARASRLRLDAEVLRDQTLALGGLLRPEIGGPPVRPYQPVNIWEPVAFGGSNTKTYVQDHGDALYRRSLYTLWKRTAPAPALATFDAPSRENFCVVRGRSNTPLQALALMNDVQQFEAARGFAERLLLRASPEPERLDFAFRAVTARPPTKREHQLLADALTTHRRHYAAHPEDAQRVVTNGESKPNGTLPAGDFAAWTMVANLLFNLDETVNRN